MKILLAQYSKGEKDVAKHLEDWGYQVVTATDELRAWDELNSFEPPGLIILEWSHPKYRSDAFVRDLRSRSHERPSAIYVFDTPGQSQAMSDALLYGVCDFFISPIDRELLKRKLTIGQYYVEQQYALVDTSAILERYAKHIDEVAKERARQLFQAERLSTIGVMSAGIAHEINTPIGYISASLETAKAYWQHSRDTLESIVETQEIPDPTLVRALERLPKALDRIDTGLNKIMRISTGLKNFGKQSSKSREQCCIETCIEETLELCENILRGKVKIEKTIAPEMPVIMGDAQQIEQVLTNLLVNAFHALEETSDPTIWISASYNQREVKIVVEDNGPGIEEEHLESIWEPFYTTKEGEKGTGLGLAISQGIIRRHTGAIHVTSGSKGGARFEVTLPRPKHPPQGAEVKADATV